MPQQHRSAERSTLGLTFEDLGANDTRQYHKSTTQQQDNTIQHNTTQDAPATPQRRTLYAGVDVRGLGCKRDTTTRQINNTTTGQHNTTKYNTIQHKMPQQHRSAERSTQGLTFEDLGANDT